MTQITPACIYLNGLILFPDKTPPLPLATYLYIMSMGLLHGTLLYGGFCSCTLSQRLLLMGWWNLGLGSKGRRRPLNEECKKKKNPRFLLAWCCLCCCWLRREWQRFQTKQFLRSLNLARRSNIIFSLHFYKST